MAAHLIESLFVTGYGTAAASGFAYFYQPNTLTPITVYSDDAAATVVTQPVRLDAAGKSSVPIYLIAPARAIIQNASGATLADIARIDGDRAELVASANAQWPGETSQDAINTAIATSLGGTDGNFKAVGAGAVNRTVRTKLSEHISVKDFGAKGDGVTDDTAAFVAAIAYATSISGATIKIPAGIYLISQVLTIAASNIALVGDGRTASIIQNTSASGNAVSLSAVSVIALRYFGIANQSTSTGAGVSVSGVCDSIVCDGLGISGHRSGILQTSGVINNTNGGLSLRDCNILCDDNAASFCISLSQATAFSYGGAFRAGTSGANGTVLKQSLGVWFSYGGFFLGDVGITSTSTCQFSIYGVTVVTTAAKQFVLSGGSSARFFAQPTSIAAPPTTVVAGTTYVDNFAACWNDTVPLVTNIQNGTGTYTADNTQYGTHRINATVAAITVTVTTTKGVGQIYPGAKLSFIFANNSGGAVTWAFNAIFKTAAVAPATGFQIGVTYQFDGTNYIELTRSGTVPT